MRALAQAVRDFSLRKEDFLAVIDGMEMDAAEDIRAPDWAKLDLYCDRVASAVGRLSVRVFGMGEQDGIALAHHLGRALQLTNILRDIDEDAGIGRLYLPQEELRKAGIVTHRTACGADQRRARPGLRCGGRARARHFQEADMIMARNPRRTVKAPRIMEEVYRVMLQGMMARGWAPPRTRVSVSGAAAVLDRGPIRDHLMARTVHIIGAGLAGLAAAVKLAPSAKRRRARSHRLSGRPLPVLSSIAPSA